MDNALQTVTLDDEGTDCGTMFTLKTIIPKKLKKLFFNRYVVTNDIRNPILLTADNIDEYVDKEIQLRSPMFCKSNCYCNKCAGELFYKMGVKNAGLLNNTMARHPNECINEKIPR